MGLFPNLFKGSPTKILSNIVFPGLSVGVETLKFGAGVAGKFVQQIGPLVNSNRSQSPNPNFSPRYGSHPLMTRQPTQYGQPFQPYEGGGGGFYDYPQQPQQQFMGGSPWDY